MKAATITHVLKQLFIGVLTGGVIVAIGFLSYVGMLALTPSIALAWSAFLLAGLVDGEVFLQNIKGGVNNIKLLGKHGLRDLIIKELNEKTAEHPNETASAFEREYYAQRNYIIGFQHKKLNVEQKEEHRQALKRLHRMQKIFIAHIFAKGARRLGNPYFDDASALVNPIVTKLPSLKRKAWYIRLSLPISVIAGIGFGFATAAALDAAFAGMAAAFSVMLWPLAIIAGIGYSFLIYRTMSDMIRSDTFSKWRKKVKSWFQRKDKESTAHHVLRVTGIGLIFMLAIGVGILATLATAGTWWIAVKNGAVLVPVLAKAANWIRNLFVPIAAAANLAFNMRNTLSTMDEVASDINHSHPQRSIKTGFSNFIRFCKDSTWRKQRLTEFRKKHFGNKTLAEIFNPFRILSAAIKLPFMGLIFLGHTIAIGLIGDRAPGLNNIGTIASAVFGALADGFVDYSYVLGREHKHGPDEPHHSHNLIPKVILNIVLSPILLVACVWDFVASRFRRDRQQAPSFGSIVKSNFGIHGHEAYQTEKNPKPNASTAYMHEEMKHRINKQRKRLAHTHKQTHVAEEKIKKLDAIELDILAGNIPNRDSYADTLGKKRKPINLFNKKKPAETLRVMDDVIAKLRPTGAAA